jgi:hypothetical protein
MTRPRKPPHPADIAQAEIVARAIRFDVALFVNRKYEKRSAATLPLAEVEASLLSFTHPDCNRRPMIYAIDEQGRGALVTPTILAILKETTTMASKAKTAAKPKKAKAAKEPKAAKAKAPKVIADGEAAEARAAPRAPRPLGKRAAIEAAAKEGKLPSPPDFSAPTHTRYRGKLAEVVALVKERDLKGLRAYPINPYSTSPKAIKRYRDLCVLALEAAK